MYMTEPELRAPRASVLSGECRHRMVFEEMARATVTQASVPVYPPATG